MKPAALILLTLAAGLLLYGIEDLPEWGDPQAPASGRISPRYIEKTLEETDTPNMVTSVLADYRSYDTLGETTVVFAAGLACLLLLSREVS